MNRKDAARSLKNKSVELEALYEVGKSIVDSKLKLSEVLDLIARKTTLVLRAKVSLVYLVESDKKDLSKVAFFGLGLKKKLVADQVKAFKSIAEIVLKSKKILNVEDITKFNKAYSLKIFYKSGWRSFFAVPLINKGIIVGVLFVFYSASKKIDLSEQKIISNFGNQCSIAIENARLFEKSRQSYLNTIKVLASIIDAKDSYTGRHSESVMRSALAIAREMKLSDKQIEIIKYASFLHDIGKIAVDVAVLRKPTHLSPEEWDEVTQHPKFGAELIRRIGFLDDLVPTILYHHARFSGGGYPDPEKKMEAIPIEARILAVADSFEAMVSDRPYRRAMSTERAVDELKKCSGSQFDPKVVEIFVKYIKKKHSINESS